MSGTYTHVPIPDAHFALCDEAITRVARFLSPNPAWAGHLETAIRAHDRRPHVTMGRHLVFAVLLDAGLTMAEIARVLELNHSTVIHGLTQMQAQPERRALYDALKATLPAVLRPRGAVTLEEEIRRACVEGTPPATPEEAAWVVAYVTKRPLLLEPLAAYHGRRLLAERPDLAAEVGRITALFAERTPRRALGRVAEARVSYPLRGMELQR